MVYLIFVVYLCIGVPFTIELVTSKLFQECESKIKRVIILLLIILFLPLVIFLGGFYVIGNSALLFIDWLRD